LPVLAHAKRAGLIEAAIAKVKAREREYADAHAGAIARRAA
jgi:hypothetical protein